MPATKTKRVSQGQMAFPVSAINGNSREIGPRPTGQPVRTKPVTCCRGFRQPELGNPSARSGVELPVDTDLTSQEVDPIHGEAEDLPPDASRFRSGRCGPL